MSITSQLPLLERRPPVVTALAPDAEHGEVFTRGWVVDLVLDAIGYRPELDLAERLIVEPSCGHGAFLLPIVGRLLQSCAVHGRSPRDCAGAIRAFDLLERNADVAREAVRLALIGHGESPDTAAALSTDWIATDDFLLGRHDFAAADFVVGNPPYVRLEEVPPALSDAYRAACPTMRGRADLYIGFFEKGLSLLKPDGRLGFICADRWMRNQYGARLRELVVSTYAVDAVIVMHDVNAFEGTVSAYPAITLLRNGAQGGARVIDTNAAFDESSGRTALDWLLGPGETARDAAFTAVTLPAWFNDSSHWPSGSPHELELLADLERRFAPLQDPLTGTKVGIGVATGCDEVYIGEHFPDIEPERLLPLLTAADIAGGRPDWSGKHLVNPWSDAGLVDLADFPGLAAYCERHAGRLRARHVARKRPAAWYRTIDRVAPGLRARPKLLFPDMKAAAHPVLDPGHFYPHHNLYYIVSDSWDLEVLGGLLLSDVANLFVGAYCVKMRGGTYRFQAQYLRKIRVPAPDLIGESDRETLRSAFRSRDRALATEAAWKVYGIAPQGPSESGPVSRSFRAAPART